MSIAAIALWALVIFLGVQTGAGLFETRVPVPLWSSGPPASVAVSGTTVNYIRAAFLVAAWIASLKAFSYGLL
jgi:hypothetical protein